METVTVRRVIAAPIEEVFDWLATTTNYRATGWVLHARLARPGRGAPYGVGAVRVHTWLIGWFRERITGYQPPHSFEYVIERCVPPARHDGGRMTFQEIDGKTLVTWTTTMQARLPFGATVTRVVAAPVVAHVFGRILDAAQATLNRTHATS
ncbi:SRPBCC family protein [Fodinicola acaciae]|uniref:SRPBCC family protein n=1 Tax=Fodinicola acaciae TaxID=2681555 RepID=UPI0013D52123|nr:SRPBCC family protein [Fodinicola acaciae]